MHCDLRNSAEDESQRILNAIELGTVVPIHMHVLTSEDFIILRGRAEVVLFDEVGNEMEKYLLEPGGAIPAVHVPKGRYHTCRSLESGTVVMEFKNKKYDPNGTEVFLK